MSYLRPDHVTRTPTNGSSVLLSRVSPSLSCDQYTAPPLKEFWSRVTNIYLTYIRFGMILTQFYVNFSRQEHQIDVL